MTSTTTDRRALSLSASLAFKKPVRVATTANVTLSGLQVIDGVTLVAEDRVLVRDQSVATENGLYSASTGNWTRCKDADGNDELVKGTQVYVHSGTFYAGATFALTTADPIVVGTSNITFSTPTFPGETFDFVLPSQFGAVGDGTTDDKAAWDNVLETVEAAGGGHVLGKPGKTYRLDYSGVTAGFPNFVISDMTNAKGVIMDGRGSTCVLEKTFTSGQLGWWQIYNGSSSHTFEFSNMVLQMQAGGAYVDGVPTGITAWLLRNGCERAIWRNIKQTGGGGGIFLNLGNAPDNVNLNDQAIIENCYFDDVYYPVSIQGIRGARVDIKTRKAGRSLFVTNVRDLRARVRNEMHYNDDIILDAHYNPANGFEDTSPTLENIDLYYIARENTDTVNSGNCVSMKLITTEESIPCTVKNVKLFFDVQGAASGNEDVVSSLMACGRFLDGVTDSGPGRGHILHGLHIEGRATGMQNGSSITINSFATGDFLSDIKIGPFYARENVGDFDIVIDGGGFVSPLILDNIDIDGDITLTNFAAGMVEFRGRIRSSNLNVG